MSVASDLHSSLRSMGFVQLLLAIVFLAAYSVACSPLFDTRGRMRGAGLALLTAAGFTALTHPWVHGVLMMACAVAGVGVFSAIGWLLSTMLDLRTPRPVSDASLSADEPVAEATPSVIAPRAPAPTRIPAA